MKRILSLIALCFGFSLQGAELFDALQKSGYAEICNEEHGANSFDELYRAFDAFIEFVAHRPDVGKKLSRAKQQFWNAPIGRFYATPFVGYGDDSALAHRKLYYFYYSTHFHQFLFSSCPEIVQEFPEIREFLNLCRSVAVSSIATFESAIEELGIAPLFVSTENQLPVLLKIVKYLPASCNVPHFDTSALSLLLDSTDPESLVFAPYQETIEASDFTLPLRQFSREPESSSSFLIAGKFLQAKGLPLPPTPHAALRKERVRYAAVAFALIPYYQCEIALPGLPQF